MSDSSDLITMDEVAKITNRSIATVRYWRRMGVGPRSVRIGRRVMVRRSDLEAWIDQQFKVGA